MFIFAQKFPKTLGFLTIDNADGKTCFGRMKFNFDYFIQTENFRTSEASRYEIITVENDEV